MPVAKNSCMECRVPGSPATMVCISPKSPLPSTKTASSLCQPIRSRNVSPLFRTQGTYAAQGDSEGWMIPHSNSLSTSPRIICVFFGENRTCFSAIGGWNSFCSGSDNSRCRQAGTRLGSVGNRPLRINSSTRVASYYVSCYSSRP